MLSSNDYYWEKLKGSFFKVFLKYIYIFKVSWLKNYLHLYQEHKISAYF